MEVQAIYKLVIEVWDTGIYCLGTIVSDNDTTMKAQLKHSFKELIDAKRMCKTDWPRTKSGDKKNDSGRLPIQVEPPRFLADPNNRKNIVGKHLYALAELAKKIKQG